MAPPPRERGVSIGPAGPVADRLALDSPEPRDNPIGSTSQRIARSPSFSQCIVGVRTHDSVRRAPKPARLAASVAQAAREARAAMTAAATTEPKRFRPLERFQLEAVAAKETCRKAGSGLTDHRPLDRGNGPERDALGHGKSTTGLQVDDAPLAKDVAADQEHMDLGAKPNQRLNGLGLPKGGAARNRTFL